MCILKIVKFPEFNVCKYFCWKNMTVVLTSRYGPWKMPLLRVWYRLNIRTAYKEKISGLWKTFRFGSLISLKMAGMFYHGCTLWQRFNEKRIEKWFQNALPFPGKTITFPLLSDSDIGHLKNECFFIVRENRNFLFILFYVCRARLLKFSSKGKISWIPSF